jgi:hypothetical protein
VYPTSIFTQIHPVASCEPTVGRTEMTVLMVAFRSCFANAPTSYFPPHKDVASPLQKLVIYCWLGKFFFILGILKFILLEE